MAEHEKLFSFTFSQEDPRTSLRLTVTSTRNKNLFFTYFTRNPAGELMSRVVHPYSLAQEKSPQAEEQMTDLLDTMQYGRVAVYTTPEKHVIPVTFNKGHEDTRHIKPELLSPSHKVRFVQAVINNPRRVLWIADDEGYHDLSDQLAHIREKNDVVRTATAEMMANEMKVGIDVYTVDDPKRKVSLRGALHEDEAEQILQHAKEQGSSTTIIWQNPQRDMHRYIVPARMFNGKHGEEIMRKAISIATKPETKRVIVEES